MQRTPVLVAWGLAAALAGCAGHTAVVTNGTSSAEVATEPPAPESERVIERPGYFWIRGHWLWGGAQWDWVGGHWEKERADQAWDPGHWEPHGHVWRWTEGHWVPRAELEPPQRPSKDAPAEAPKEPPKEAPKDAPAAPPSP